MGLSPILSIIHTITIGMMLSFKNGNNGHGLKNGTYKQTLKVPEIRSVRGDGGVKIMQRPSLTRFYKSKQTFMGTVA